MLLFFIRHGDPIYEPDSLTPLGERQAEAAAKRLALYGIDEIYASSSKRAFDTAKPLSELVKKEITVLDWCNESHAAEDFHLMEGSWCAWVYQIEYFKKKFVSNEIYNLGYKWYEHPDFQKYTFGRGVKRVDKETDSFMKSLGYIHDRETHTYHTAEKNEKRIALFAHEGFGKVFLSSLLDIPYPQFSIHFTTSHTGITVIEFPSETGECMPLVLQLSNDSHLYKDGLTTKYNNLIYF